METLLRSLENVFGDYQDKKRFMTSLADKLEVLKEKVRDQQAQDIGVGAQNNKTRMICTLKKDYYRPPKIEIP